MGGARLAARAVATGSLAVTVALLASATAWAAPEGRIQSVTSKPGEVVFAFSAEGLEEGQSIDPASVRVTIGGVDAPSTAKSVASEGAAPVERTVMLVLDSSGSMADFDKLTIAQAAAKSYLQSLPADVRAGLVSFDISARVNVAPTLDRAAVAAAVDSLQPTPPRTTLNDAVILAVETLGDQGSRNAVLLSDGKDVGSEASAKEARDVLSESGVVLDAVSLGAGEQESALAAFARSGDGTVVTATNSQALTAAFESAARTVASQLSVTAQVPVDVQPGTVELTATALVGESQITDSAAAIISPPASPTGSESDAFGPIAIGDPDPGVLGQGWFLLAVIAVIFVALATITSVAVGAVDAKNRKQGRVSRRLQEVSSLGTPGGEVQPDDGETVLGQGVAVRKVVSFADRVAATRDTTALAKRLEEAGVALRPGEWAVVHGLIAILAGLLTTLLSNFNIVLSLLAFALGLILPWLYLTYRADRRKKSFYKALPDAMQMLAGSLSAGYSLPQALDNVARETGGVLGEELTRALLESRLGLPIDEALEATAQRMDSRDFHWVVMAIRINRQVGGNLSEVLTNVSRTLRERERLRRQVKALSAEGVLSGWILGLLPFIVLLAILVIRPEYILPMLTQPVGWLMLAVGLVLYLIGVIWMRNLVNMEV